MAEHADNFQLAGSMISDGRIDFFSWTHLFLSISRFYSFNQSQYLLQLDGVESFNWSNCKKRQHVSAIEQKAH